MGFPIDGIWLDMNEVSNYCTGDVCAVPDNTTVLPNNKFVCELDCVSGPASSSEEVPAGLFKPPFAINNGGHEAPLNGKTLPISATHYDGTREYDVHNLYAHYQSIATAKALAELNGKRHFLFTRSTFVGTGAYAAHWTGDTLSSWDDLRATLPTVLSSGIAGIPFVGADICGFMKYASEELCARWAAAGAWYPYARDHHADGFQEFWRWPKVADASRKAFGVRYRALPYLYTAFADSRAHGCPVARPLFMAFPADRELRNLHSQWLMGDGLLVSPVLRGGRAGTDAYFPAGTWYSLHDGSVIDSRSGGKWVTLDAGLTDHVPLHVLGGTVLPLGPGGMTTKAAREGNVTLLAALPRPGGSKQARCGPGFEGDAPPAKAAASAWGSLYYDGDGESVEAGPPPRGTRALLSAHVGPAPSADGFEGAVVVGWPKGSDACAALAWPLVDTVVVRGVAPVRAADVKASIKETGAPVPFTAAIYDAKTATLTVTGLAWRPACPDSLVVSFQGDGADGVGTAADTSSRHKLPFSPTCDCDDKAPPNAGPYTCKQQAAWGKCTEGKHRLDAAGGSVVELPLSGVGRLG